MPELQQRHVANRRPTWLDVEALSKEERGAKQIKGVQVFERVSQFEHLSGEPFISVHQQRAADREPLLR